MHDAEKENLLNAIESYKQDRAKLRRAERLLREIYGMYGPRDGGELVTPDIFSKMTKSQVGHTYDFPRRDQMHRIARALSSERPRN